MKDKLNFLRVGTTRSGKLIPYSVLTDEMNLLVGIFNSLDYTGDDFLDAIAVYTFLAVRSLRKRYADSNFDRYADAVFHSIEQLDLEKAKSRANIKSAFELRDLGRSLVSVEFL
jgi:hypothetical protein